MQRLGQHFLKNLNALRASAESVVLDEESGTIIEVGPGHGELTDFLVEKIKEGRQLILIEKDTALAPKLKEKFKDRDNVEVREGDALKLLPKIVAALPDKNYSLAGNIPYYITGKLLHIIGDLENKPRRAVMMVQEEVAERICAVPPEMNRLAASVQFWAEAQITLRVPRQDFLPPPEVDSAVVALITKEEGDQSIVAAQYYQAVRAIFAQPRKTLLNNLASGAVQDKNECKIVLGSLGIDPESRPQDLDLPAIILLAEKFFPLQAPVAKKGDK